VLYKITAVNYGRNKSSVTLKNNLPAISFLVIVAMLSVALLSVIMLSVVMLSVIMQSAIMLSTKC
jgi:hypothetical protein